MSSKHVYFEFVDIVFTIIFNPSTAGVAYNRVFIFISTLSTTF